MSLALVAESLLQLGQLAAAGGLRLNQTHPLVDLHGQRLTEVIEAEAEIASEQIRAAIALSSEERALLAWHPIATPFPDRVEDIHRTVRRAILARERMYVFSQACAYLGRHAGSLNSTELDAPLRELVVSAAALSPWAARQRDLLPRESCWWFDTVGSDPAEPEVSWPEETPWISTDDVLATSAPWVQAIFAETRNAGDQERRFQTEFLAATPAVEDRATASTGVAPTFGQTAVTLFECRVAQLVPGLGILAFGARLPDRSEAQSSPTLGWLILPRVDVEQVHLGHIEPARVFTRDEWGVGGIFSPGWNLILTAPSLFSVREEDPVPEESGFDRFARQLLTWINHGQYELADEALKDRGTHLPVSVRACLTGLDPLLAEALREE